MESHDMTANTELLRIPEVARYLAISRGMVYRLMDTGQLSYVKIGKSRRVERRTIEEFIEKNRRGGTISV
jgi:excisionase family DNA binding protein